MIGVAPCIDIEGLPWFMRTGVGVMLRLGIAAFITGVPWTICGVPVLLKFCCWLAVRTIC